jgi:hypothetical protein
MSHPFSVALVDLDATFCWYVLPLQGYLFRAESGKLYALFCLLCAWLCGREPLE